MGVSEFYVSDTLSRAYIDENYFNSEAEWQIDIMSLT